MWYKIYKSNHHPQTQTLLPTCTEILVSHVDNLSLLWQSPTSRFSPHLGAPVEMPPRSGGHDSLRRLPRPWWKHDWPLMSWELVSSPCHSCSRSKAVSFPDCSVQGPGPALLREMGRGDHSGRSLVWNRSRMAPSEIAYEAGGEEVILFPTEGERKNSDSETISVLQLMFYNSIAHCQGFYSIKWVHACLQGLLS